MRSGSFKRNHGSKKGVFHLFVGNQRSLYGEEPRPGLGPESMMIQVDGGKKGGYSRKGQLHE